MKIADIEVTLIDHSGSDLSVVNAARVSFDKESEFENVGFSCQECGHYEEDGVLKESDKKLINYLAKHKHFSPFNHAFLSFRVKAPIFVARQLVKHKFMPWNEISRRYVDSEPEFYIPKEYRAKADNVKQGSSDQLVEEITYSEWCMMSAPEEAIENLCITAYSLYVDMLESGVCAEQARMVLPLNTMTEWWWSGTLGAFLAMLELRLDPHTQYESQIVAQLIAKEVENLFPVSYQAMLGDK